MDKCTNPTGRDEVDRVVGGNGFVPGRDSRGCDVAASDAVELGVAASDPAGFDVGPQLSDREWALELAEYDARAASQVEPEWFDEIFATGVAHDVALDDADELTQELRRMCARQFALFARVLRDAATCPDPWCGPDPTLDPGWESPRGLSAGQARAERRALAVRAAVCDLAVRTRLSEQCVRARAGDAETVQRRCPLVWAAFAAGEMDERNLMTTAWCARSLPEDDPISWQRFDETVVEAARALHPGKFRTRARALRERIHPEPITHRHGRAQRDRGAWLSPELDGMATFTVYAPAADLHRVDTRVDRIARHLRDQPGEARTIAQLRADIAVDLLARADTAETRGSSSARPSVAVTVPVLNLLGASNEPAVLDGYGPIDHVTARRLAADAPSFVRILTHPIDGTVLDLDRTTYRIPSALRRWLGARDPVCTFPGCSRLASDCDIDHRLEWHQGGATSAANTAPLCRSHHRVKTESHWRYERDPEKARLEWISPSGKITAADPPPW